MVFVGLASLPSAVAAQNGSSTPSTAHLEEVLSSLDRGRPLTQVAVSPDGKLLAWTANGEIRVAPSTDLAHSRRVTALGSTETGDQSCAEGGLDWSPDSSELAFLSDCDSVHRQEDLYLARIDGSMPRRVTHLAGYVHEAAFSPDGSSLAFLYVQGATRPAGALAAMKPPSGVIGEEGVEVQQIAVVRLPMDASTGPKPTSGDPGEDGADVAKLPALEIVTPANLHVYEFDWSPDSKSFAYIAARPPGENNWWVAKLYVQTVGGRPKAILAPAEVSGALHGLQIAVPRWSPGGKRIAFIGGLMSDQGSTGGDVWVVDSEGGQLHDLTSRQRATAVWLEWNGDQSLYVSELAQENSELVRLRLRSDPTREADTASMSPPIFRWAGNVGDGRMQMSLSSTADHSVFVFHASTFERPVEIYAVHTSSPAGSESSEPSELVQLSHFNDGVEPAWGQSVSIAWMSDGFHVQGWLLLPKDYNPREKYPLIVEVHGGPAAAVISNWGSRGSLSPTAFSVLGYFVFQPNPRGSFGQGEAFTQANRKDFGYGDLRDILAGVDAVESRYPIDPNRVGITGWSYGGFMTMFAVTQTHRFKAAVAGAGISDWLSYYGENSIDQWMIPYFGASVYDDPAVYSKSSAIDFIKQARTPTLSLVGDRDGECPAPQSFEFWHALRALGVPTQLIVYPNEGHGFVNPAHRRDVLERTLEWFARYMPAGS
jgi:dipeptidyl aminopeptidase/acylaminoacyl peptidase